MGKSIFALALGFLIMILSACGAVESATKEYDLLVTYYNDAVQATKNFGLCVDTAVAQVNLSKQTLNTYVEAEIERVAVWREARQAANSQYTEARTELAALANPANGPVDLNQMVSQNATPADVAGAFDLAVDVYAPTEATLSNLDPAVFQQVMQIQSESVNLMMGCALDWNAAATLYNTERDRIGTFTNSGRIIGDAVNYLGISALPAELPLYESKTSDGTIPSFGS